ncbi:MFS transporter [Halomicrococcus gelatinilyticus]|uniref:MFS transporter n=1 Tax=Halomicrococcus gelatinilyticus TaxID=1702103 RepID=UPI002E0E59B6
MTATDSGASALPDRVAALLPTSLARRLAVLADPGFRRLLAARSVSKFGDGLYSVAAMWLVYDLTGSTAYTGLAGVLTRAPGVLKILVGPLVDRASLDRVLTYSEVVQGLVVLAVPLAAALGHLDVVVVLAVMPLLALANLFAGPAQTAALPRLVDEDRLVRANSVASVVSKTVDTTSNTVAGALVALAGGVAVYVVDAVTFAVAALAFASLSVPTRPAEGEFAAGNYLADLRAGVALLAGSVAGRMLVASTFANFLTGVALAVLPAFAASFGGASTYGLLLAGMTAGTVVGSVAASGVDGLPMGRVTVVGFVASAALWTGAVVVPGVLATVALFAASRVPHGVYNVSAMATVQTGVPDDLLGRVSATVGSASSLVLPAGMLVGGLAGERLGSRTVMLLGGVGTVLAAAYWLALPSLRRFGPPTAVTPGEFGGQRP